MSAPVKPAEEHTASRRVAVVLVGDEVTAAGYRLGGARTLCPSKGELGQALDEALATAHVVLLTVELAEQLPPERRARLFASREPLVSIVPSVSGHGDAFDVAARARRILGMEVADEP